MNAIGKFSGLTELEDDIMADILRIKRHVSNTNIFELDNLLIFAKNLLK